MSCASPSGTLARRVSLLCVVLFVLTACAQGQEPTAPADEMLSSSVDVDTPRLRAIKKEAGIEPCREGPGSSKSTSGMPDVTLPCLGGGQPVNLRTLRGPMVVNLWAQWCGPCREELPFYQRLHEDAGPQLSVIGIDWQDTQPARALQLASESGVTYPLLADPAGQVREAFRVRGLPGVVLVDRAGAVVAVEYVLIGSYDQLRTLVRSHLGVPLTAAG